MSNQKYIFIKILSERLFYNMRYLFSRKDRPKILRYYIRVTAPLTSTENCNRIYM
jgi:hypothetical protein